MTFNQQTETLDKMYHDLTNRQTANNNRIIELQTTIKELQDEINEIKYENQLIFYYWAMLGKARDNADKLQYILDKEN